MIWYYVICITHNYCKQLNSAMYTMFTHMQIMLYKINLGLLRTELEYCVALKMAGADISLRSSELVRTRTEIKVHC